MEKPKKKLIFNQIDGVLIYGFEGDYIPEEICENQDFFESFLLNRWKPHFENSNFVLDIGANIGNHSLFMATQANCNNIIAFEPVPEIYCILAKNISENHLSNIKLVKCAVGKSEGFAKISNEIENNFGATSLKSSEEDTGIKVISIDEYLANNEKNVDFVKIDVEGFEIDVLKGMVKTISKYKPKIWVEVSIDTFKQVNNILSNLGYKILDFDESRDFNLLYYYSDKNIINFDTIFHKMLYYCLQSKDLYWKNRKNESHYLYEQKKCDDLLEQNRKKESKLLYEQKKLKAYKEMQSNYINQIDFLQRKINAYQSRRVVRIADYIKKIYAVPKSSLKNHLYIFINDIYLKIKRYPSITKLMHKINNRFNLIDKESALKTYSKNQKRKKNYQGPKKINDIKAAVIMDEFTYNSFRYEFNCLPVDPKNWQVLFEIEKPDLFICESAWSGADSIERPWKSKIYSSINFKHENRLELLSILDYCKKKNIPTIFWNKEDPTHYGDEVHNFIDTALKFDHIFTTAEECVPMYMDKGHKSVHCLPFAGQPKLFNPIEKFTRTEDIVFAGSWYNNHNQRCIEMAEIFDSILDGGYNLKIHDREYGTIDPNRIFPDKYIVFTHPPVKFNQIDKVYKESKYGLNINTVTKSKTMFARRVFELMLCNTLVLSNYSMGMDELFGDNVVFVDKTKLDLSDSEEKRENNLYNVLENHTYSKRFKQILNAINFEYIPVDERVTLYYVANNQSEIDEILKHYESVDYSNKKLALLLSKDFPNHLIKNLYQKYANNNVDVYSLFYLLDQGGKISNDTSYFVFSDTKMEMDFIKKAILHYSYIDKNYGITFGDNKFKFDKFNNATNVLFDTEFFNVVFDYIFGFNSSIEIPIYLI